MCLFCRDSSFFFRSFIAFGWCSVRRRYSRHELLSPQNSQNRNIDTGKPKTVASLATIVFSSAQRVYSAKTQAQESEYVSLSNVERNRIEIYWSRLFMLFTLVASELCDCAMSQHCSVLSQHTIHLKMKTKNEVIENRSGVGRWVHLLSTTQSSAIKSLHTECNRTFRCPFAHWKAWPSFYLCLDFAVGLIGRLVVHALSIHLQFGSRFHDFPCVCVFVCVPAVCAPFWIAIYFSMRDDVALLSQPGPIDTRQLIMCRLVLMRTRLKWNRNRLCEPCSARTHLPGILPFSSARTIYFYFSFTGTITENISLFLISLLFFCTSRASLWVEAMDKCWSWCCAPALAGYLAATWQLAGGM